MQLQPGSLNSMAISMPSQPWDLGHPVLWSSKFSRHRSRPSSTRDPRNRVVYHHIAHRIAMDCSFLLHVKICQDMSRYVKRKLNHTAMAMGLSMAMDNPP